MAKLVFLGKEFGGRTYELRLEQTTVGRAPGNTLVIQHKSISHHHCEILTYGEEVIVRDLNSTNGTYVDGARLNSQAGVRNGQVIRFGDVEARLEQGLVPDHSSEVTAIYEHARAVRDQRREKAKGPVDPHETIRESSPSQEGDSPTLILPGAVRPEPVPLDGVQPAPVAEPRRASWWWLWALVALGALALLIVLWVS